MECLGSVGAGALTKPGWAADSKSLVGETEEGGRVDLLVVSKVSVPLGAEREGGGVNGWKVDLIGGKRASAMDEFPREGGAGDVGVEVGLGGLCGEGM